MDLTKVEDKELIDLYNKITDFINQIEKEKINQEEEK